MAIRYWLAVAHRDHVRRAVQLGVAQLNYGRREGLEGMRESDGVAFYSARDVPDGNPVRSFTAVGRVADDDVYRVDGGDSGWRPWRRRVDFRLDVADAPIRPLLHVLELTRHSYDWGLQLRPGFLELSRHDFEVVEQAMRVQPGERYPRSPLR
ncbi:EVE domain-containing protein [Labedella endophytica]|uniref:EVE domain-containing protein n=1 Tax=Labedella endophytica TaxID=1523160 RepID=A0A433JXD8_9MICO|nr:EVE domain-containing protein [Labedella endophytica]RUR03594.1 EVE domain-containing protein [Labedella endophytica]